VQDAVIDPLGLEVAPALCELEDHRCHRLLRGNGAGAILNPVHLLAESALSLYQRPQNWRPAEHGSMSDVENVMEAVCILMSGVVVDESPELFVLDAKTAPGNTVLLIDMCCEGCDEATRKPLVFREPFVERENGTIGGDVSSLRLCQVRASYVTQA
jgi:hypothetical protein